MWCDGPAIQEEGRELSSTLRAISENLNALGTGGFAWDEVSPRVLLIGRPVTVAAPRAHPGPCRSYCGRAAVNVRVPPRVL